MSIIKYEYHEFSQVFDMLDNDEMQSLADKMRKRGFRASCPIVLFEGKILDGRNRYEAANVAGVEPCYREFDPNKEGDPLDYVWDMNVERRHLTTSQRAMAASRMAKLRPGNPDFSSKFPNSRNSGNSKMSQEAAAKKAGVSVDSVMTARKVQEKGTPELIRAVDDGDISVNDAANVLDKPADIQIPAIEAVKQGTAKTVTKAVERLEDAKAETIMLDEENNPVPLKCRTAFQSLAKYREADALCRSLQKVLDDISKSPGGEQFRTCLQATKSGDNILNKSEHIDAIKRNLAGYRPHAICPYCAGQGTPGCKGCQGKAWVTKTCWNNAEESIKAQVKCA